MNTTYAADYLAIALERLLRSLDQDVDKDDTAAVDEAISRVMRAKTQARLALGNFYEIAADAPPPKAEELREIAITAEEEAAWRDFEARR